MENEHKKLTAEDSDEKSEEEDEWEAMEVRSKYFSIDNLPYSRQLMAREK